MVLKCNDELGVGRLGHIAYQRRALCSLVRRVEPYVVGSTRRPAAGVLGDDRLLWVLHLSKYPDEPQEVVQCIALPEYCRVSCRACIQ